MAMPQDLVLVRHGQSEGNIVQRAFKDGGSMEVPPEFLNIPDWKYRLSEEGIKQAEITGEWLQEEFGGPPGEVFDAKLVSPYLRARETAVYIGGPACEWLIDNRLPERDWGVYNSVLPSERDQHFPHEERMRQLSSLHWRPTGGESLDKSVQFRFRDWLGTLHREHEAKKVLAVSHGEFMWVARYVLERMLPEEWEEADENKSQRIYNTSVLHYTRVNPEDSSQVEPYLTWRRMVVPWDEAKSPFGGEWQKLPGKRLFSGEELLRTLDISPPIFRSEPAQHPFRHFVARIRQFLRSGRNSLQ